MTFTCEFDANPRGVVSGKTVRFFPRVSGNTSPITNYNWDFGDGSSPVDEPTPIHTYPVVTEYTTYDVTLVVTDSNSNTATTTHQDFITSDVEANVVIPDYTADVWVYIYDSNNSMMVKRRATDTCPLYLLMPKTTDQIDKIGTATFSLLDIGNSTSAQRSLIAEGKNVTFANSRSVLWSGVIRRATQDTQNGFENISRLKKWNIECDSDLARHKKYPVASTVLMPNGRPYFDSPGYITRAILTPPPGLPEIRGVIDCIDPKIAYQLNSAEKEEVGSQYEHLMTIRDACNYDLRTRPYGEAHLGAEFVWGYLPVNGNFSMDWMYDYPFCGWTGYEYDAAPYQGALSTATCRVKPTRGKDGTNGMVLNITVQNDDGWSWTNFFYMYVDIETRELPPTGATGVSFDYKIVRVSEAPTIVDTDGDWRNQKMLDFYLYQDEPYPGTYWKILYHAASTPAEFVPGDWIHVDITADFRSDLRIWFALEANWDDNQATPYQKYEFEVVIDNVRWTGYSPETTWAAMRLFDSPMWEYWDYSYGSGCGIPGTNTLYHIPCEDFSGMFPKTLFKSLDGGVTWSLVTAALPNDVYCYPQLYGLRDGSILAESWAEFGYGDHQNLLRSTDGGVTWVHQCDMPFQCDSIAEDYDGTLYSANGTRKTGPGAFYKSTDKGVTWQLVCAVPGWLWADGRQFICLANGDILGIGEQMNAVYEDYNGTVWRSTNKGVSWTYVTTFGTGIHWDANVPVQDEDGRIIVQIGTQIRISSDNGNTWATGQSKSTVGSMIAVLADGTTLAYWGGYGIAEGNSCWQSTDHGASWQLANSPYHTNQLQGTTVYFDNGVSGVVTDNDHYWAVCHNIANIETVPPSGTFISPGWYVLDFAPDISQPHVVKNLDVNKDCFGFNDNDDKSKLSTQIVVRGKDYGGKSISVQVAGVHAFDNDRKFFNDSTYINQLSEGYIYKNSYATDLSKACTFTPGSSVTYSVGFPSGDKTLITVGTGGFAIGNLVSFTNPPAPLVHNQAYYIVYHTGSYIKVSSTVGGSPISLHYCTTDYKIIWGYSGCVVSGTAYVVIKGTNVGVALTAGDTNTQVRNKIIAAVNGYTDSDGIVWTVTAGGYPYQVEFTSHYEGLGDTPIDWDENGTYCTASFDQSQWVPWTGVDLTAADVGTVTVNNLDGWFTENMQLEFGATELPAGISAGTTYNVGNAVAISATAVFMLKESGSVVNFTTAGSDVVCFKPNTIRNADENGNPCVWLYGWGYAIKDGDNLAISIPGESASAVDAVGTPIEVVDLNGTMCTTVQVSSFGTQDYGGGKGFLLNKKLYVEDADIVGATTVLIGEEAATIASTGLDTVYGPYIILSTVTGRVSGSTNKCYPHGLGALVAKTTYTYYAETVVGDFETGDLTGWTDEDYVNSPGTAVSTVTTGAKHGGTYGYSSVTSGSGAISRGGRAKIGKTINSNFGSIGFWYKVNALSHVGCWAFKIQVSFSLHSGNAFCIPSNRLTVGEWTHVTVYKDDLYLYGSYFDATTLLEVSSQTFLSSGESEAHSLEVFFDDIVVTYPAIGTGVEPGSPIDLYGIHVLDETVDNNVTYGDLDAYATMMLLGLGNFYKKATCWLPLSKSMVSRICEAPDTVSIATPIMVGDRISTTEYLGATPEEWEVVGVETVYDEGRMKLELGDYEKNIFTSLERKTNALNRTMT